MLVPGVRATSDDGHQTAARAHHTLLTASTRWRHRSPTRVKLLVVYNQRIEWPTSRAERDGNRVQQPWWVHTKPDRPSCRIISEPTKYSCKRNVPPPPLTPRHHRATISQSPGYCRRRRVRWQSSPLFSRTHLAVFTFAHTTTRRL